MGEACGTLNSLILTCGGGGGILPYLILGWGGGGEEWNGPQQLYESLYKTKHEF